MLKRLILGMLLVLSATLSWAQTDTLVTEFGFGREAEEQALPWPLDMQWRLDSMMRHPLLDCTQVGLMVWDLTDNRSLFACNHRQLLRPASTMKVLTAVTALDVLGGDYQFTTSLYYKGEILGRTLMGDLYCVGGMDPAFSRDDLKAFAESLYQVGIDTICGKVVADLSMKDTLKWGEGWCWDDKNPTLSPLLVDRKANFTAQLVSVMAEKGIVLRSVSTDEGVLPKDAVLISQRKRSIDQILERMMKDSDNLYAEATYYQIAAREDRQAKALYAQRQQKALMERAGLPSGRYRLADGSGLSLYNYLSAEAETKVLRYAFQRPAIYNHLLPALPVAGVDGTLKKRMKGTPAEGNIRAKTGTLTGIISLAGYCTASNGHLLCFAIINQGVMSASEARGFQDSICTILCE
ncbi:MAG: D-alanyl-D-alanine carboxypeptidase/D-alanyl-D-alanine-endopeptidase [Prevotella sp.]|nr:D-alanyl-D-alanine carboxypeptidase/D-alanyl-D-alanine-endopeptidase [Prevotella sp.]